MPAGSITDWPGSSNSAQPVKCARTRSTTVANLDSQPRTVDLATPSRRAIRPPAIPAAADVNARQISSTQSIRRSNIRASSSTWVALQARQRDRRGRTHRRSSTVRPT